VHAEAQGKTLNLSPGSAGVATAATDMSLIPLKKQQMHLTGPLFQTMYLFNCIN
jgi:hypothetical protein